MKKSRRCKNSRAREKHEAADINENNQVTRINLSEKTSMAESTCTACLIPLKKTQDKTPKGREYKTETYRTGAERDRH